MSAPEKLIKPLDQAIADLVEAARAEARAAALDLPHLVRVPDARDDLRASIEVYVEDLANRERARVQALRLRPLLEVLEHALAHPDAEALCLESPTDVATLRRLFAAAAIDHHPPRRST